LQIVVTKEGKKVSSLSIDYDPSCVTINQQNNNVAVGSTSDNKVDKSLL
jgi:hypothetical protein